MPNTVCPVRAYTGHNPSVWVGHKITYDANGGGAAGTYTSTIVIPPGCYLLDVQLHGISLWTGSSTIAAIVGDSDDDNGFITSTNLKATDLIANEVISVAAGTALAGGLVGAYIANSQWTIGSGSYARYSPLARSIICKVTAAGTATAGETHFLVGYVEMNSSEPLGTPVYAAT